MPEVIDLKILQSEGRNPKSLNIDVVSTAELCRIINDEDQTVAGAVQKCLPTIARAVDALTVVVQSGGRVIYVGAGTSGR
jgi:N-acetylmuramic acid 6-phosphate etherase